MTLVQLEYAVAVDTYRSFVMAAEKCFVSQPTLSVQIQKLEEQLNVKLFHRNKQPVVPTEIGTQILQQARIVLAEADRIKEIIDYNQNEVQGELRLGIIPTIAPYLLPQLLPALAHNFPKFSLQIGEFTTESIITQLKAGTLDCAILATPLHDNALVEHPLYYENFMAYLGANSQLQRKKVLTPNDLATEPLWLLNKEHCMRAQILNICNVRPKHQDRHTDYNTGSIHTLVRMVDFGGGNTIIPELAFDTLTSRQQNNTRPFKSPAPARQVSLVTGTNFIKMGMLRALQTQVNDILPKALRSKKKKTVVDI